MPTPVANEPVEEAAIDEAGPLDAMQMDADTPIRYEIYRAKGEYRVPEYVMALAASLGMFLRNSGADAVEKVSYGKTGPHWALIVTIRSSHAHRYPSTWGVPAMYGGLPVAFVKSHKRDGEPF